VKSEVLLQTETVFKYYASEYVCGSPITPPTSTLQLPPQQYKLAFGAYQYHHISHHYRNLWTHTHTHTHTQTLLQQAYSSHLHTHTCCTVLFYMYFIQFLPYDAILACCDDICCCRVCLSVHQTVWIIPKW